MGFRLPAVSYPETENTRPTGADSDPVQEETKVDTSAPFQSKSVILHPVHRPCCQQSMK